MKIIFIGAGNVAWHLALLFTSSSHSISKIWSRTEQSVQELAKKIEEKHHKKISIAFSKEQLDFSDIEADLAILAISDRAFDEVLPHLVLPSSCILVHTSGALAMETLKLANQTQNIGVFYPLQTFTKNKKVDFEKIPFCIEADTFSTENLLIDLAKEFSKKVFRVSSKDRSTLHVAAVFACNFANHLWAISEEVLRQKELPFDMLEPLLRETLEKALTINPSNAQTGPALRKDTPVIEKHLQMIQEMNLSPHFCTIYKIMTKSIQEKMSLQT